MTARKKSFGLWLSCALAGWLAAYVYAVVAVEPVAHSSSLSAWQWFWESFGRFSLWGLLLGSAVGLLLVWRGPIARSVSSAR